MITTLKQDFEKKRRSNFLKSDLNKYLVDNNQNREYQNRIWFKGSRNR